MWFLIISNQNYISVIDLPLSVYEPRPDMTLGEPLPKMIKVRVEGAGLSFYLQKWSKKASLILDVGTITHNERLSLKSYFNEHPNQVLLHKEMRFMEIVYPDSIDIRIDRKISKSFHVQIVSDISLKPGYIRVGSPDVPEVTLTGPENYIASIRRIETEPFNKENADITFQALIPVKNPNPELVEITPASVGVQFEIEMIGERTIPNIPVRVRNQPSDLEIQLIPNLVSLRVTGGNDQIQSLTPSDFTVYFDYLTQWFPNRNYYPVKITPPAEVLDIIRIVPEQIEVVVVRKKE